MISFPDLGTVRYACRGSGTVSVCMGMGIINGAL